MQYWTMEKIEEALNRGAMAASAEYPIEQLNELLLIAGDMLELVERANAYKKRNGVATIYTYPEFVELFENTLRNYPDPTEYLSIEDLEQIIEEKRKEPV